MRDWYLGCDIWLQSPDSTSAKRFQYQGNTLSSTCPSPITANLRICRAQGQRARIKARTMNQNRSYLFESERAPSLLLQQDWTSVFTRAYLCPSYSFMSPDDAHKDRILPQDCQCACSEGSCNLIFVPAGCKIRIFCGAKRAGHNCTVSLRLMTGPTLVFVITQYAYIHVIIKFLKENPFGHGGKVEANV